jgi:hypothetical protein
MVGIQRTDYDSVIPTLLDDDWSALHSIFAPVRKAIEPGQQSPRDARPQ